MLIPAQFIYFDLKERDMLAEGGLMKGCIQHEAKREMITCTEGVPNLQVLHCKAIVGEDEVKNVSYVRV